MSDTTNTTDTTDLAASITINEDGVPVAEVDYQALYHASKQELERSRLLLAAQKATGASSAPSSKAGMMTAQRVRATVGELAFLNMGRAERMQSVGADPSVSPEFLSKLFGRGGDANLARDLYRTSPDRYRILREAAIITGAYAV